MTIPREEISALLNTREFLVSLLYPTHSPRVPKAIREEASHLLKHYPWSDRVKEVYTKAGIDIR